MAEEWEMSRAADSVLYALRNKDMPDGRFREGTISGQMQSIYLTSKELGITLDKKALIALWRKQFEKDHAIFKLRRERRQMLRTQVNLARRIKEVSSRIDRLEGE